VVADEGTTHLTYGEIERARTVFSWAGPQARRVQATKKSAESGQGKKQHKSRSSAGPDRAPKEVKTQQRGSPRHEQDQLRVSRRPGADRARQGHLRRDLARRAGQRPRGGYKRRPDAAEEAVVTIDPESGEIRVYGQELDEDGNVVREWDDTPDDFGRIAAQTAKQVILQRIAKSSAT